MSNLVIQGTKDWPYINCDKLKGEITLQGTSLPENVLEVYGPVLKWLNEYCNAPNAETRIDFFFDYLNTASSHMIAKIIYTLQGMKERTNLIINWCYVAGDYDIRDFGSELLEEAGLQFHLVEKNSL